MSGMIFSRTGPYLLHCHGSWYDIYISVCALGYEAFVAINAKAT
jgi:hypothetical protein